MDDILGRWSLAALAAIAALGLWTASKAHANDPAVHGNAGHEWYSNAETTLESRPRFNGQVKCCAVAEVVRAQFRVDHSTAGDTWWYLDRPTNQWRPIPDDIIHWGEHAPDKKPTLFIWAGHPVCFWPPEESI